VTWLVMISITLKCICVSLVALFKGDSAHLYSALYLHNYYKECSTKFIGLFLLSRRVHVMCVCLSLLIRDTCIVDRPWFSTRPGVLRLPATGTIVILSKVTLLFIKGTFVDRHTTGVLTKNAPLIFIS